MNTENRLSVKEAAKLMGAGEHFIRIGLQEKVLPFGYAVKTSSEWTYFISSAKFTEYTGIEVKANVEGGAS